jgi:hypothetical protein
LDAALSHREHAARAQGDRVLVSEISSFVPSYSPTSPIYPDKDLSQVYPNEEPLALFLNEIPVVFLVVVRKKMVVLESLLDDEVCH